MTSLPKSRPVSSFVLSSQSLRTPVRARLNPFAPPFADDLQQQAKIDRHNDAILRQTYGYHVGRLPLDEYDMLVETTRELYKSTAKPDPIGEWFDKNGIKESR